MRLIQPPGMDICRRIGNIRAEPSSGLTFRVDSARVDVAAVRRVVGGLWALGCGLMQGSPLSGRVAVPALGSAACDRQSTEVAKGSHE